jgi:hypothetical protein
VVSIAKCKQKSQARTKNTDEVKPTLELNIVVDALCALCKRQSHTASSPFSQPRMASATITTKHQTPIASYSPTQPSEFGRSLSFSSIIGAYDRGTTQAAPSASAKSQPHLDPNMSFTMSQGSQNNGLMLQPGSSFRHYADANGAQANGTTPQIYSVSS